MKNKLLFWTPRILSILFAAFISLFALDVFGEGHSFWEAILGLLIHLVPTYLVIIATLIAWKREIIGGSMFIALGLFYIFMTRGRMHFSAYLFITIPLILIGVMFILHRQLSGSPGKRRK